MTETTWEADKMLDVYIHDYFIKRDLKASAQTFKAEGKVSSDPVAIDAPGGFLLEWWSVFWDIFIARTSEKASDAAASYIETQLMKAREHQRPHQQQLQQPQLSQHQQQMQVQQFLLQRQAQQQQQNHHHAQQQQHHQHVQQLQHSGGGHLLNGTANGISENDSLAKQNPGIANSLAAKLSDQKLNLPLQRDSLDDAVMKQRLGNNASSLLDSSHASIIKSAATPIQPSGPASPATAGGMAPHVQSRSQLFPGSAADVKPEINPILNARGSSLEGSLIGVPGSHNQGGNNLTLKGLPLMGLEQLRSGGLLQQPKSIMPAHQSLHQLQMLTPHHQQQLMLAQPNLMSPSGNDIESRRLKMLLNNQNLSIGKDGLPNPVDNLIPNIPSPLQAGGPALSRADPELLMKLKFAQLQQQKQSQSSSQSQQQQIQQLVLSGQQPQSSNQNFQDKVMGPGHVAGDGSMLNSFHGNDQCSKDQTGRKRRHPTSSSGPVNSSGTPNTAGPSPSSAPSTPSTQTAGDVMSMQPPHSAGSSKPMMTFGADSSGTLKSQPNQMWDDKKFVPADMDHLMDDVEDNVESFLSHDDAGIGDDVGRGMDVSKGFTFAEVSSVRASSNKVVCCHFSSDGKLLASGDHDKKVVLWHTDSLQPKYTLEEHSSLITDVRFSPSMARLATSSFDKTVRVWDADNPCYSIRTFTGHSACVTSLDFHPNKEEIICSCDDNGEIRYWSIKNGSCTRVFRGSTTQVRFQPRHGRYLAGASDNIVSILDAETQTCCHSLKGHTEPVHSICWDPSGELLASVSDDSVKVWTLRSGSEGECLHELSCNGNKFYSCVFHPTYPSVLIIGCYQSLELWNLAKNAMMPVPSAHEGLIASLAAVSAAEGLVASASHDKFVKLWK